jgi:hypothetical protein
VVAISAVGGKEGVNQMSKEEHVGEHEMRLEGGGWERREEKKRARGREREGRSVCVGDD